MHSTTPEFYWIEIAILTVLSSARITRLLTFDKFPPIMAVRHWYQDKTDGTGWQRLSFCGYCMSPWVTAVVLLSGWFTDFPTAWWLVNAISGGSYLAATYMAFDGDEGDE